MAASGIAEHDEARRRQAMVNRRAHKIQTLIDEMRNNIDFNEMPTEPPLPTYETDMTSSYVRKVGSPPGFHNYKPPIIDKLRREQVRQQQMVEYSAKLPKRLSSTDYTQQW